MPLRVAPPTVLHESAIWTQQPEMCLRSREADVIRASGLQHAIQDADTNSELSLSMAIFARVAHCRSSV